MHTPSSDEVLCVHGFSSAFQDLHEACSQACWKWPEQIIPITSWTYKKKEKLQCYLGKFAILVVLLSVQEPIRDFVLTGVSHNGDELLYLDLDKNSKSPRLPYENFFPTNLFFRKFTSSLGQVNIGFLENNIRVTPTNTLDGCDGKHNLLFTINVRIKNTQNMLKLFRQDQRLIKNQENDK